MAGNGKIDLAEVFGIVGGTASGIGDALAPPPPAPLAASNIDLGGALIGAGIGAGVAYATKSSVGVGAVAGGLVGIIAPMLGIKVV